jgi:hypothetical protein
MMFLSEYNFGEGTAQVANGVNNVEKPFKNNNFIHQFPSFLYCLTPNTGHLRHL